MMKKDFRPDDATKGNPTEPQPPRPAPHVRPARVFRTLVLTALAALPLKACSGARPAPADQPQEAVGAPADDDAGSGSSDAGAAERDVAEPDAGGGSAEPADGGSGTVFRGGATGAGGASGEAEPAESDGNGRVWRGGPGEEHHADDRDAGERDDGRRLRDDAGPPRRDYGGAVEEYGVPIPDPTPMPLYGVEPYPVPAYGVEPYPVPPYGVVEPSPAPEYAAPIPDDDGPVLRYGVPFPDDK
jgi:hypothetical protein